MTKKPKESISRADKDEENLRESLKKDYKGTIEKTKMRLIKF